MSHSVKKIAIGQYTVGLSTVGLSASGEGLAPEEPIARQVVNLVEHPEELLELRDNQLSGRSVLARGELGGVGPVVMKSYSRGGVLRHFIGREHLRVGRTRAEHEFRMLSFVRRKGVRAPEPIAWVSKGALVYHAWLVTREIVGFNLAELTLRDGERARVVMEELTAQMNLLIEHRVCHIDLHPGNVMVTEDDEVYVLDFDKAYFYRGRKEKLREHYLRRWRRAVIKHELPELLSELMCLHLRRSPA